MSYPMPKLAWSVPCELYLTFAVYHIHAKPVPADGNCTATGAHLDPYNRGETPLCDSTQQNTCQTGDLSGKHGNITEESISIS